MAAGLTVLAVLLSAAPPAKAAFPGAGGKVAFVGSTSGPGAAVDIYTVNSDGTGDTNLTFSPCEDRSPAWSADGSKIAWSKELFHLGTCTGDFDIYTMNADGSGAAVVTAASSNGVESQPSFSPDGTKVAFVRGGDVYSAPLCTGVACVAVNLTNTSGITEDAPAWSPDGTKIAYQRNNFSWDIYTMNADGSGQAPLIASGADEVTPNWRGDGGKLTYMSTATGTTKVYTINADGSGETNLQGPGVQYGTQPAWSPDGSKIAFYYSPFIETMNPDGTGQGPPLTSNGSRIDTEPDWQPLASPYETPFSTPPVSVGLTPVFRQCGTAANPANTSHGAPDIPGGTNPDQSCNPPVPTGTARVGPHSIGSARLAEVVGPDVQIQANVTDVTTAAGADYNPSAGADLTLSEKIRITDTLNGGSQTTPATVTDLDFGTPVSCTPSASTVVGSTCDISTSANAVIGGLVKPGKRAVTNIFRVRVIDAGPDTVRGNADDKLFLMQGLFTP